MTKAILLWDNEEKQIKYSLQKVKEWSLHQKQQKQEVKES